MQSCQYLAVALKGFAGVSIYPLVHAAQDCHWILVSKEPRPCQQPTSYHHPFKAGKSLCNHPDLLQRCHIPVVHHRMPTALEKASECLFVRNAFILLLAQPGVQHNMLQGHLVDDGQQAHAFFCRFLPQAHLYRKHHLLAPLHLLGNFPYARFILQQPAAPASLHLHGKRTPHVQVNPVPPLCLHGITQSGKLLPVSGYHLRHRRHTHITPEVDVPHIFLAHALTLQSNKRRVILIHTTSHLAMRFSIHTIGIALQGGKSNIKTLHNQIRNRLAVSTILIAFDPSRIHKYDKTIFY